ncbi:hypothetical protein [Actinoplanes sp. NPDC051494]|uniref:hypothetical protein n=1 Tax=Actinoplanes sp. NPDC051494 TaxID=3363907 RepID=UPI00379CDD69
MTSPSHEPDQHQPGYQDERTQDQVMWARVERRRARIRGQILRNRQGGHKIPTWLLATILGLLLLGWAYLIFFD